MMTLADKMSVSQKKSTCVDQRELTDYWHSHWFVDHTNQRSPDHGYGQLKQIAWPSCLLWSNDERLREFG